MMRDAKRKPGRVAPGCFVSHCQREPLLLALLALALPAEAAELQAQLQPHRVGHEDQGRDDVALRRHVLVIEVEDATVDHPVATRLRTTHLPYPTGELEVEIQADARDVEDHDCGDLQEELRLLLVLSGLRELLDQLRVDPSEREQPGPVDEEAVVW